MLQNYWSPLAERDGMRPFSDVMGAGAYQAPFTLHTIVETEGGLCDTASQPATIKLENQTIEVEEWSSVENEVAFE